MDCLGSYLTQNSDELGMEGPPMVRTCLESWDVAKLGNIHTRDGDRSSCQRGSSVIFAAAIGNTLHLVLSHGG